MDIQAKPKVGWVLAMDRDNVATRLQGYLIHEYLLRNGVASAVVAKNSQRIRYVFEKKFIQIARKLKREKFTHVVFENPEWAMFQLARIFKMGGGISICVRCDNVPGLYDTYFDSTIFPTETLANSLAVQRRNIIPDSVEVSADVYKKSYVSGEKIQVVWVGHQGYEKYLTQLVKTLQEHDFIRNKFTFTLVSKGAFATKQWSEATVFSDILEADIALIPIPEGKMFVTKSSNRLAMMMALGMPIIASRIPSYLEVGVHKQNLVFINEENSIVLALQSLQDEEYRAALGLRARTDVGSLFSIETIGALWKKAILTTKDATEKMPAASTRLALLNLFFKII